MKIEHGDWYCECGYDNAEEDEFCAACGRHCVDDEV